MMDNQENVMSMLEQTGDTKQMSPVLLEDKNKEENNKAYEEMDSFPSLLKEDLPIYSHQQNELQEIGQKAGLSQVLSKNNEEDWSLVSPLRQHLESGAYNGDMFEFIEEERSCVLSKISSDMFNDDDYDGAIEAISNLGKEIFNWHIYRDAIYSIGEQIAEYKWAYDEGKLGEFDKKKFLQDMSDAAIKSSVMNMGNIVGNGFQILGANLANSPIDAVVKPYTHKDTVKRISKTMIRLGRIFKETAQAVNKLNLFSDTSVDMTTDGPSWGKAANVIGGAGSQVLGMRAVSKMLGPKMAYLIFATGNAGDVFSQSYEKDEDVVKANILGVTSLGLNYAVDKIFNPIPKQFEQDVKKTTKMLAKEIIGSSFSEASAEVLQQLWAENLIRKVGIDPTQDLFEGLLESALGGLVGSSSISLANNGVYFVNKTYNNVRRYMRLNGVSENELDLFVNNSKSLIENSPEAFEKVLGLVSEENMKYLEDSIEKTPNKEDREKIRKKVQSLDKLYQTMYDSARFSLKDNKQARVAASMVQSMAMFMSDIDPNFSIEKMLETSLPQLKGMSFNDFLKRVNPDVAISFMMVGPHARKSDKEALGVALSLEKQKYDKQYIWEKTGWYLGSDGKPRTEISDAGAKLKLFDVDNTPQKENALRLGDYEKDWRDFLYQTAEELQPFANSSYAPYLDEFMRYMEENPYLFKLYDEEALLLHDTEILAEHNLTPDHVVMPDQEKIEGIVSDFFKKTDFGEEEAKVRFGYLDRKEYLEFAQKFLNPRNGNFTDAYAEYFDSLDLRVLEHPIYQKKGAEIFEETTERFQKIKNVLKKHKIPEQKYFFDMLERERAYRLYRLAKTFDKYLQNGLEDFDSADNVALQSIPTKMIDTSAYFEQVEGAFMPKTLGEKFLMRDQFEFLSDAEKKKIAEVLNMAERFHIAKKVLEKARDIRRERQEKLTDVTRDKSGEEKDISGDVLEHLDFSSKLKNGITVKLGDILDHQELYDNYPIISEVEVQFKELEDSVDGYHFYDDYDGKTILEIDARKIPQEELLKVLLKGGHYAVQSIENFDHSLTETQRKNFMDRLVYRTKSKLSSKLVARVVELFSKYLPDENKNDYIIKKDMPVSLMGLYEDYDTTVNTKMNATYMEADYHKIAEKLKKVYGDPNDKEKYMIYRFALAELHKLKNDFIGAENREIQMLTGYEAGMFPFGGYLSQGVQDERIMIDRMYHNYQSIVWPSYLDTMKSDPETMVKNQDDYKHFNHEFSKIAKGAYQYGDKIATLFETADMETLVHEMYHYFSEIIASPELRYNAKVKEEYYNVLDDYEQLFLLNYRLVSNDGIYVAVDKKTNEVPVFLQRAFNSEEEAIKAGANELFVHRMMELMKDRIMLDEESSFFQLLGLYGEFVKKTTDGLKLKKNKMSDVGRFFLAFLDKFKK